ncbi:MAG TPA: type II/IV secretion system protein [Methylococcales bacterium]|nr:type II/IV secretion system protein [Methylococcales bacterium]
MKDFESCFFEQLKQSGTLSNADLAKACNMQARTLDHSLSHWLIKLGLCSDDEVAKTWSKVLDLPVVNTADFSGYDFTDCEVSVDFLKHHHVVGLAADSESITIAVCEGSSDYIDNALNLLTGKKITKKIARLSEIDVFLQKQFNHTADAEGIEQSHVDVVDLNDDDLEHLKDLASEAPVIKTVNHILQKAVEDRASDIHFEPFERVLKIRMRIDGVLFEVEDLTSVSSAAVLSRIKLMAKMNIAERRLPQDGRIKFQVQGKELDLRVSTIPTLFGESIVIRVLSQSADALEFSVLGFNDSHAQRFIETLTAPNGIVLITGPTGSGKSTTLYSALKRLNNAARKIVTVEDPIEYQLKGINQIQVQSKIGLSFAKALRAILRQDPDVIMVGEMRDVETAQIAVQSALTGHLVLSTLHTNNASAAVTRLIDMGLERYLLTSTINGILAQRLVRKLCPECKEPYEGSIEMNGYVHVNDDSKEAVSTLYRARGCLECHGVGYRGRIAIFEFLKMSESISHLLLEHGSERQIQEQAIKEGMQSMYLDGMAKARLGITTVEEVLRVISDS